MGEAAHQGRADGRHDCQVDLDYDIRVIQGDIQSHVERVVSVSSILSEKALSQQEVERSWCPGKLMMAVGNYEF